MRFGRFPIPIPIPILSAGLLAGLFLHACSGDPNGSRKGSPASGSENVPSAPQRVLLVTIDTLRADHLRFAGYPRETTPFLDRLAAEGIWFEEVRTSCSHTAPAHASLFTGLHPPEHGVRHNGEVLDDSIPTLAERYRDAGWKTAAFTPVHFLDGTKRGFEHAPVPPQLENAAYLTSAAWDWIRAQPEDQPWFVWIHLFDVHEWPRRHWLPRSSMRRLRQDATYRSPAFLAWVNDRHGVVVNEDGLAELLARLDRYDAQIRFVDEQLGWLDEQLTEQAGDILWVVTADHGEGLGNHDFLGHGKHVYEEQLRVPLVMRWPEVIGPGHSSGEALQLVDLGAGLVDLLGDEARQRWGAIGAGRRTAGSDDVRAPSGRPLWAAIARAASGALPPREVVTSFAVRRPRVEELVHWDWTVGERLALVRGRYKLIASIEPEPGAPETPPGRILSGPEFFDLASDPYERFSLGPEDLDPEVLATGYAMLADVELAYREMRERARLLAPSAVDARHREELEALGYLDPE